MPDAPGANFDPVPLNSEPFKSPKWIQDLCEYEQDVMCCSEASGKPRRPGTVWTDYTDCFASEFFLLFPLRTIRNFISTSKIIVGHVIASLRSDGLLY